MGSITPTPIMATQPRFLVIGAGSRGHAYARAVNISTGGTIAAVAEPDDFKRREFGQKYIWGENNKSVDGQEFKGWNEWLAWESERRKRSDSNSSNEVPGVDGVFICTLDETHAPIIQAIAPLNLHILCEKPLALSLSDCLSIQRALHTHCPSKIFSIGHVLRYSPHNTLLRDLLVTRQVVGEVVSIEHTEPVGWWHFAHSYVRGNWRRQTTPEGVGSLLTKSCHDIDFLLWLLCSPSALTGDQPHLPSTVSSAGALTQFRRARKPRAAAEQGVTNCTKCPVERECIYSAVRIYRDRWREGKFDEGWPLKIVLPDIEDLLAQPGGREKAEKALMDKLGEDYDAERMSDQEIASRGWYGRCVYDADNDVVDDQTVLLSWDGDETASNNTTGAATAGVVGRGPKHALFHMVSPTLAQCERRGRIYGSLGEISYDSSAISVYTFVDNTTVVHEVPKHAHPDANRSHGGGDWGLAGQFVAAVQAVDSKEMSAEEAQRVYVGCDLDEVVRSHAVVFAAEEARREKRVVRFKEWWDKVQKEMPTQVKG